MLTSDVLLERIAVIESQRSNMSADDKIKMLTMQNPHQKAGFFSRVFSNPLPKQWSFPSESRQDKQISHRLIGLILEDLIPAYQSHAIANSWFAQCLSYEITHINPSPKQSEIEAHIEQLNRLPNGSLKTDLFKKFKELNPSSGNVLALARDLKRNNMWSEAIAEYEHLISETQVLEHDDQLDYIESMLWRNSQHDEESTDAQMALYLLLNMDAAEDRVDSLKKKAITLSLPEEITKKRGEATNPIADMGRSLTQFSKSIGGTFGGRESEIPYSKGVVASAPSLLTPHEIGTILDGDEKSQQALESVLKDNSLIAPLAIASTAYSAGLLWSYSQIDQSVLNALTFASAGQPENFSVLQEIAGMTLSRAGAISRMHGYVAEQMVALNLTQQGHIVEFPDTANQTGFDLIVDGQAMQVKSSLSSEYVLQHFEKYPDIPVIVNQELAETLGNHPNVFVDYSLSHADVQQTTVESLGQIDQFDSVADMLPIPLVTIGLAAYRNYGEFGSGQIDSKQYLENTGKEAAAVAGGAIAGKIILGAIGGMVAGPVGIALAGGLGAYIGGVAGSTGANSLNREKLCDQRDRVVSLLIEFAEWFNKDLLDYRVQQSLSKFNLVQDLLKQQPKNIGIAMSFVAYQFELYYHADTLQKWVENRLNGNQHDKVQAGWVCLQQSQHFISVELRKKVYEINRELEAYKKLASPSTNTEESLSTVGVKHA